jgi:cardiolipin synthase A/B
LGGLALFPQGIQTARVADPDPQQNLEAETLEVAGSRITVLVDGAKRLEALIGLIEEAKESLRLLYYTYAEDETGTRVRDALLAAVARGVRVSLLVDGFGTDASKAFFKPLVDTECRFCRFVPRWGRRFLLRNHQKLALADGDKVIVGGFNISDEYFGTPESGAWRDLGVQVEGPSVSCLVDYFEDLFTWALNPKARIRHLRHLLGQHSSSEGKLHWLFGGPTRRLSPWARSVKRDLLNARRVDIITAYFAPSRPLLRRIYRVARRGRARIVTAAKSDNVTTIGAARHTYWRLLKRGAEIYEYQPTKLHTKLAVIDDTVHIGSANFDMRSLYLNLEMMLRVDDPGFAALMRRHVDNEVRDSVRITREMHHAQRTLLNRIKWGAAFFLLATADYNLSRRLNFGTEKGGL